MFVTACKCGNYAVCPILIKNLLSSDKIPEISIDAEVTNLVQMKMEKSVYFAFMTCAAFFDKGGVTMRTKFTPLETPLSAGQTPSVLFLTGYRAIMRALCFAITILSIHYHQFNLTAHFAFLQGRRLSIRSKKLFWRLAEVKLNL
jgi:hypothetical protein